MPGRAPRATPLAHISGHARIREGSPLSIRGRPTGTLRRRARNQRRPFTRSRSALSGSFAFTTPDESRTPTVPSSNAFATSLRAFTPAPQSTLTFGFAACMRSTAFVMTSGFAVVTLTSPPISSGGSIAMYSGESFARVSASTRSSAQAITSRPSFWHRGMLFAISSHATLRSLWLISVPAAPASRRASGGIHPIVGPGSTASTCWLNTGRWTSFAMCARSDVGGTRTIDAPVSSATAAKRFASSQPLFPRISGYVLRFKTMAGFRTTARMALPSEIGLACNLRRAARGTRNSNSGDASLCRREQTRLSQRQNSTSGSRRNASSPVRNRAPIRRAAVYPIASAYDSFGRRSFSPIASNNHSSSGSMAIIRNRANCRWASISPRSRRTARYSSTRFQTLVRSSAARYLRYCGFPRTTSMSAYVSRKNRGVLPAPTEFVFQFLRIHGPVSERAERVFDSRLVDFEHDFVACFEPQPLRDLARHDDSQRGTQRRTLACTRATVSDML